jgi:DNA repair/transcription protein MET18/MMS19
MQIFQPTDPITEEEALKTAQVLIRTIYAEAIEVHQMDTEDIQGLAREACEECIKILQEPEKSQARPAIKVLCAFMTTTRQFFFSVVQNQFLKCLLASVSRFTISQAVPHLVKLFLSPDELPNRPSISVLLAELVAAARDSMSNSFSGTEPNVPLMPFKDEVLGVFTVGLKVTSSCQPALVGLRAMVTTPALLTDEELGFIVHNVNDILQADPNNDDDSRSDKISRDHKMH